MRKNLIGCVVVLSVGALVAGGCAKKDLVKGEEPVSAAQTAPAAKQPAPSQPAAAAPVAETPAKEAAVKQESKEAAQAAQLQSELEKIYFNFDSAALSDESRNVLTKNAALLGKQPSLKLRIEGNCDERGSDEYNMALGERRAKAAKDYLVNLGVQADRISTVSYGEEKPAVAGHDEASWAKNRRDEFVIVK
jgi:peptidoglycan-associated lipoprotein